VERALAATPMARLLGARHRLGGLVLAYHNIVPDGEPPGGDRSLHLPRCAFAAQLDLLQRTAEVIPLAELLAAAPARTRRPLVAITFDDAYRGAMTAGVGELRARGLPASVFVAPDLLGRPAFWWDALADPAQGLPETLRDHALGQCDGQEAIVRRWAAGDGKTPREQPHHAGGATVDELNGALEYPALSLGSHSWSHPNLTRLTDSELEDELSRPLPWLREQFPRVYPWLAYPYGISDARVEQAAGAAGYEAAFRVDGGWLGHSPPPFALPRFNVPAGISLDGFRLRLAGLLCR